ncbi:MAG TPA: cell division protein FtsZ [Candidatus Kapabacteria bacterium]|nr:cell division protein FtsZ [Candidatus Kapabacteria bacterium]
MIELDRSVEHHGAKIKIVGVGGGGGNAVNSMIERGLSGCEFVVVNTDMQALEKNQSPVRVQIGKQLTRGLGAGANPTIGHDAALEDRDELRQLLAGTDMVFVTAGMGGGTGTGGAPIVAQIAREAGTLVVGIVTRPFDWEGKRRKEQAEIGLKELKEHVDTLIVVPNQKLLSIIDKRTGFKEAFQKVDDVLYNATRGIAEIITGHGVVNVDFADVRTVMANMGDALMGTGVATGEYRATEAAQNAISSPLLEGISISGSEGVLINIAASSDLTMMEVDEAVKIVHDAVGGDANLIFGVVLDDNLGEAMMVTVIATGFNKSREMRSGASAGGTLQQRVVPQQTPAQQAPAQQSPQQAPAPVPQQAPQSRPVTAGRDGLPDHIPVGLDELEKYNEPAYLRRGAGIHRGGYDITRKPEEQAQAPQQPQPQVPEQQQEMPEEKRRQATADKPAFLRRIMD